MVSHSPGDLLEHTRTCAHALTLTHTRPCLLGNRGRFWNVRSLVGHRPQTRSARGSRGDSSGGCRSRPLRPSRCRTGCDTSARRAGHRPGGSLRTHRCDRTGPQLCSSPAADSGNRIGPSCECHLLANPSATPLVKVNCSFLGGPGHGQDDFRAGRSLPGVSIRCLQRRHPERRGPPRPGSFTRLGLPGAHAQQVLGKDVGLNLLNW